MQTVFHLSPNTGSDISLSLLAVCLQRQICLYIHSVRVHVGLWLCTWSQSHPLFCLRYVLYFCNEHCLVDLPVLYFLCCYSRLSKYSISCKASKQNWDNESLNTYLYLVSQDVEVYIGQRRTALLRIGAQMRVGKTLDQLLSYLEPRIKQVLQVMSFSHTDITAALSDRVRLSPGNKESIADSMRAFKSSPGWCLFQDRHNVLLWSECILSMWTLC